MPKQVTTLTDEEKEIAKEKVRAMAREFPLMEMVEVEVERPRERIVKVEYSRETGKWRMTRCMEHWKQERLCEVEREELQGAGGKPSVKDPGKSFLDAIMNHRDPNS